MPYDWTQHLSDDRMSGGRAGRRSAPGGVYVNIRAPKGLRFDWSFYARIAFDCVGNALSNCDTQGQRELMSVVYDLLVDLDKEEPFLSHLQRRASVAAERPAFDEGINNGVRESSEDQTLW